MLSWVLDAERVLRRLLMLDEVDVFLKALMTGNVGRNAFICIFICILEYIQSILFLINNIYRLLSTQPLSLEHMRRFATRA